MIEDERANIEQLEEYKIIQEKAMQEEIYGDVDWYHNWQRNYYKGEERMKRKKKPCGKNILKKS